MEAAAPTLEQSLAFPDGIARDGDDNAGDIPYGIDDIDDYDALVEPRPGEAYTQEDVNVMDRPEFDRRYAQHAWYRRLGEVGMGEDNFPGTTDARRRGRQVSFLLGAPTVWERNIDARRRHIQTNAAIPDPRMGDTRTRVREAENPGLAWQTPDQVARDIDQEFQDFHNEQMRALRTYGTERRRQAVERQRRRHAEERRQAEELRRIERVANDPANAFDVAQDMREYIDNGRERAQALQQAGDGKMGRDAGTKEPTDQGGSGRFQTGGVDDRTTAEKLRDKQREVQAARDRLAGAEYTRLGTTNAMKRATTDDVRVMGPAGRRSTHIGVTGEARQQYTHGKRQRVSAPAPPDFGGTGVANYHAIVQKSAARVALRQAESEQDALQRQLQQEQAFEQAMQQAQAEAEAT
jgi:hypothetical protein